MEVEFIFFSFVVNFQSLHFHTMAHVSLYGKTKLLNLQWQKVSFNHISFSQLFPRFPPTTFSQVRNFKSFPTCIKGKHISHRPFAFTKSNQLSSFPLCLVLITKKKINFTCKQVIIGQRPVESKKLVACFVWITFSSIIFFFSFLMSSIQRIRREKNY